MLQTAGAALVGGRASPAAAARRRLTSPRTTLGHRGRLGPAHLPAPEDGAAAASRGRGVSRPESALGGKSCPAAGAAAAVVHPAESTVGSTHPAD